MKTNAFNRVKVIFFVSSLLFTSTLGYLLFNFILLFFLSPAVYRWITDKLIGTWLWLCVALMEFVLGIKIVLTGDVIPSGEKNLIIMNHRTRLDWMYFWSVLVRQSGVCTEKILLKKELKHIPGAGWSMQCGGYVFVKRRWEEDRLNFDKVVQYYSKLEHNTQILIFPEGTNLTKNTKAKSDEYAKKNNLETYDYLLHPRTTGFGHLAHRLAKVGHVDAIYDVTVGYPKSFPEGEMEFIMGKVPQEVHFHIKRYQIKDLPLSEDGLRNWCSQRWAEKETRLKQFYIDKNFTSTEIRTSGVRTRPTLLLFLSLIYWGLVIISSLYAIYMYTIPKLIVYARFIFIVVMEIIGGFELFQIDYYLRFFKYNKN